MTRTNSLVIILMMTIGACRTVPLSRRVEAAPPACSVVRLWRVPDGNFVEPSEGDGRSFEMIVTHARMDGIALAVAYHCSMTGSVVRRYSDLKLSRVQLEGVDRKCVVETDLLVDAWGTEIALHSRSGEFELRSAGPDRRIGTTDDIMMPGADDPLAHEVDVRTECVKR
jgi:hypothetical protein